MRVLMISLDRGLLGDGFSGDVVARHKRYADLAGHLDVIVFAGAEYERRDWAANLKAIPTRSRKRFHFQTAVKVALELTKRAPYDLLVTQDLAAPAGVEIKKVLRIPWIVNIHGMFFSPEWLKLKPANWYLFYLVKKAIKSADAFRVNNQAIARKLVEWRMDRPILVQPTPIDVKEFFVSKIQNPVPKILFVGRLEKEKNVGMLVRAVKNLKEDFRLEIVGEGSEQTRLLELARGDGRIKFLGPKKYEDLPELYRQADIFVLPSNTESFGQVLVQAAAAGCAIIATKTTGAMSIIQDQESGILVEVGDQMALTKALARLITDAELRQSLGAKARLVASRFDSEKGIIKTVDFWQEIAGK